MEKESTKVVNFNDMIKDIEQDIDKQIESDKEFADENFNEKTKIKNGIMSRIWKMITMGLLKKFKIKITLYYNNNVVFEYEIPKN